RHLGATQRRPALAKLGAELGQSSRLAKRALILNDVYSRWEALSSAAALLARGAAVAPPLPRGIESEARCANQGTRTREYERARAEDGRAEEPASREQAR